MFGSALDSEQAFGRMGPVTRTPVRGRRLAADDLAIALVGAAWARPAVRALGSSEPPARVSPSRLRGPGRATRSGRSPSSSRRERTPGPSSTRSRRSTAWMRAGSSPGRRCWSRLRAPDDGSAPRSLTHPTSGPYRSARPLHLGGIAMRCPWCGHRQDKVVDSRPAERGESIRRRRQCLSCGRRYTTYERVEELGLLVVKRDGSKEPWDRDKMVAGIRKAIVNRPVDEEQVAALVEPRRGAPAPQGPGDHLAAGRPRGAPGAPEARPGGLRAVRQRLQGLPGGGGLRARVRPPGPEEAVEAAVRANHNILWWSVGANHKISLFEGLDCDDRAGAESHACSSPQSFPTGGKGGARWRRRKATSGSSERA